MSKLCRPVNRNPRAIPSLCPLHISRLRHTHAGNAGYRWSHPPNSLNFADDEVARLAAKPPHQLTLSDLMRHGKPPLKPDDLISSANFSLSLLPSRLARRIQALRNLPFIVVSNKHISKIYHNYLHSFSTLTIPYQQRQITTVDEEIKFTEVMADLVQTHSNTIPILARGFLECRKYISPADVTHFLDEHLRARIGTRLIAEQHIALHFASQLMEADALGQQLSPNPSTYIGVIDTDLRPADIIRSCEAFVSEICELKYGVRPRVMINGNDNASFTHVPVHLEYIITELLKNSFRAVVENGQEREPIEVTIATAPDQVSEPSLEEEKASNSTSSSLKSPGIIQGLETSAPGMTIRIRDRGGGISPENLSNIWSYNFTTFGDDDVLDLSCNGSNDGLNMLSGAGGYSSSIAGLGYGLPLSRAYAEYFGGGIAIQSLWGWGTDVYLHLRGIGKLS
ncbi:MAG: hypothetical protein M1834_009194 [Cirrosporium novae-zelandiae]|nr:MAG: hypothetical protein M1834_009194 [Cirrosporium novae-zelandiae]